MDDILQPRPPIHPPRARCTTGAGQQRVLVGTNLLKKRSIISSRETVTGTPPFLVAPLTHTSPSRAFGRPASPEPQEGRLLALDGRPKGGDGSKLGKQSKRLTRKPGLHEEGRGGFPRSQGPPQNEAFAFETRPTS